MKRMKYDVANLRKYDSLVCFVHVTISNYILFFYKYDISFHFIFASIIIGIYDVFFFTFEHFLTECLIYAHRTFSHTIFNFSHGGYFLLVGALKSIYEMKCALLDKIVNFGT